MRGETSGGSDPPPAPPFQGEGKDAGATAGLSSSAQGELRTFCEHLTTGHPLRAFPMVVLVDDSDFTAASLNNFLWITFTRSNPARDIDGPQASVVDKHWGCRDTLVIDARIKPHHAPPLIEDPAITWRVDQLAARGGPLHGIV